MTAQEHTARAAGHATPDEITGEERKYALEQAAIGNFMKAGAFVRAYDASLTAVCTAAKRVLEAHEDTDGLDFGGWCQVLAERMEELRAAIALAEGGGE